MKLLASTILLCFPFFASGAIYCPLKWQPLVIENTTKKLPNRSVAFTASTETKNNDFVGKVYLNGNWVIGRVSFYQDGRIHVADGDQALNFSTFQVLTNPDKCLLRWEYAQTTALPDLAVSVIPESQVSPKNHIFIGRGELTDRNTTAVIGGYIFPEMKSLHVAYEGASVVFSKYEALTSRYPTLSVDLEDFVFQIGPGDFMALEETRTKIELIDQDNIMHVTPSEGGVSFTQRVEHEKTVTEVFKIEEDLSWDQIRAINNIRMGLWFGGADVTGSGLNVSNGKSVRIERERKVSIHRDFTIPACGANIQVCSIATFLDDASIRFSAKGAFYHEGESDEDTLSADQVAAILRNSGRDSIVDVGTKVIAEVEGVVSGRFFLRTLSFVKQLSGNVKTSGSCLEHYTQWEKTTG